MSGFKLPPTDTDSAASLRNSSLPARPRAALEALFSVSSSTFERYLQTALTEFEQQLFRLADQARSNEVQQYHLEAMREVRRARADVAPRFLMRLEQALASIDRPSTVPSVSRVRGRGSSELTLVDEDLFEEQLTLQEIATRAELRYSQLLYLLGQRFAVMVGRQTFEPDELPIGPYRLCECLRTALSCLDLKQEHRFQLYKVCDRVFFGSAESLYVLFNEVLIQHRILPYLAFQLPRRARDEEAEATAAAAATAATAATPAAGTTGAAPAKTPAENASAPSRAEATPQARPELPADLPPEFRNPETGWPGMPRAQQPYDPSATEGLAESFENLRSLLAWRRPPSAQRAAGAGPVKAATHEDLDGVLRELQGKVAQPVVVDGRTVARTMDHLRQDLMNALRRVGTPGAPTVQLSPEDSDTVDLLGLMFEQLARDQRNDSPMLQLLTRLQLPIMRIALRDRRFFTRPDHPARQLLNSVAEAGHYWLDEETDDRHLVERMESVVERAGTEFNGDIRVFEDLTGDLSKQIGTMVRKSEVAERRHIEAARGREKLESARAAATEAIESRVALHQPPALLRTVLEQAWADVLALTILRHSESSEIYRRRVATVDRLIEVLQSSNSKSLPATPESKALREELEGGLKQIGYHDRDIVSLTSRLFDDTHDDAPDSASLTEVTLRLKARSRLGVDSTAGTAAAAAPVPAAAGAAAAGAAAAGAAAAGAAVGAAVPVVAQPKVVAPLTDDERKARANLLTLPFGTWFEFKINQQGLTVRRKLAWYSTVSGNCLFVNQRGARTEERTLDQLARELVRGNVKVIEANTQSLLERRWSALVAGLRATTGFGRKAGQPAAAGS